VLVLLLIFINDDNNTIITLRISLSHAGQTLSFTEKIVDTLQSPLLFFEELAQRRKHGFVSPFFANTFSHPWQFGLGQSKSLVSLVNFEEEFIIVVNNYDFDNMVSSVC